MEDAGEKLKRIREALNLTYRDVEEASLGIAERHENDEFVVSLSRLFDIENKGTVPGFYRLYTLCAIYRLDPLEVMEWYGVDLSRLPADAARVAHQRTHALAFGRFDRGMVRVPLYLDPGVDLAKTTYLSRMIQRWGKIPLMLLGGLDLKKHRYGFIGTDDWMMYPILQPGSLVVIDENRRKIMASSGWSHEMERPIYFFEHRDGYACGWCDLFEDRLVLQPHPFSRCTSQVFDYPSGVEVIGQVTGIAMRLDQAKRRRARS